MEDSKSKQYSAAGVNLDAADESVARYKELVRETRIPGVLSDVGGFGGLFALRDAGLELRDPVMVSGTDVVETKLKITFEMDQHDTIGIDCVAMCVNDVIVTGARPLFFLDYLATGKLNPDQAAQIVHGVATACIESGCALIGGETAEMPGFYSTGEYDVAGFCVGIVERDALLKPENVQNGDVLIGLNSTGFHSNGYSLVRKVVADRGLDLTQSYGLETTLGDALLAPTRLYTRAMQAVPHVKVASHITGGGFHENIPRVMPAELGVRLDASSWEVPSVIRFILEAGKIDTAEAYHVFNMGIGFVMVVAPEHSVDTVKRLSDAGFKAQEIGHVTSVPGVHIQ